MLTITGGCNSQSVFDVFEEGPVDICLCVFEGIQYGELAETSGTNIRNKVSLLATATTVHVPFKIGRKPYTRVWCAEVSTRPEHS